VLIFQYDELFSNYYHKKQLLSQRTTKKPKKPQKWSSAGSN